MYKLTDDDILKFTDKTIQYYTYFYSKFYNRGKKYHFKPSDKVLQLIVKFIISLSDKHYIISLGDQFFWNYFVFQFKYWYGLEIKSFNNKIQPSFILGDKAVERWFERDSDYDWTLENNDLIINLNLNKNDLISHKNTFYKDNHEIQTKKKFHNTANGFDLCLTLTTLFNPAHECCISCNFQTDCQQILKETYPYIYAKRIGD